MARDFLKSSISKDLYPVLAEHGFVRYSPKHFISISGDVVRNVAFQLSRWGGKAFYVHLYLNSLLNPLGNINAMPVGERLRPVDGDSTPWEGSTEEAAQAAIASVIRALLSGPLSRLVSVRTLKEYMFEYLAVPRSTIEDFEMTLVFARLGERNRPFWTAERILSDKSGVSGDEDYINELVARMESVKSAASAGKLYELTERWRREYMEKSKISCVDS